MLQLQHEVFALLISAGRRARLLRYAILAIAIRLDKGLTVLAALGEALSATMDKATPQWVKDNAMSDVRALLMGAAEVSVDGHGNGVEAIRAWEKALEPDWLTCLPQKRVDVLEKALAAVENNSFITGYPRPLPTAETPLPPNPQFPRPHEGKWQVRFFAAGDSNPRGERKDCTSLREAEDEAVRLATNAAPRSLVELRRLWEFEEGGSTTELLVSLWRDKEGEPGQDLGEPLRSEGMREYRFQADTPATWEPTKAWWALA